MRFVLSTIGTSSLTNQIRNDDPSEWRRLLRDSANHKMDDLPPEAKAAIDTLADRALGETPSKRTPNSTVESVPN